MRCGKAFVLFLFVILASSVVFAEVSSLDKTEYSPGELLTGKLVFNLNEESKDAEFSVRFSGVLSDKVDIIDVINSSDYSCVPSDCEDDYKTEGSDATSKSFDLSGNKFIGFKLSGITAEVTGFGLDISSNAQASCSNQLEVDVLSNDEINFVNKNILTDICGNVIKSKCNKGSFPVLAVIEEIPYCEKINLSSAPAFQINAGISGNDVNFQSGLLKAKLFNNAGQFLADCNLTNPSNELSSCTLSYAVKEKRDYFVCVSLNEGESSNKYTLKASQTTPYCGFQGDPSVSPTPVVSYDITAYGKKYSNVGNFGINTNSFAEQNTIPLINYLNNYLSNRYDKNCSDGCVVPIKFSGISQHIVVNGLNLGYKSSGLGNLIDHKLYDIKTTPAKLNSDNLSIDLADLEFNVPSTDGNYTLKLFLEDKKLFEENISVLDSKSFYLKQLYPRTVSVLTSAKFIVFVDSEFNMSDAVFKWDFGDETTETSYDNKISHVYSSIGNYTVKVELYKNSQKVDSKSFKIVAESPKNAINSTLEEYKGNLEKVEIQVGNMPEDYQEIVAEYFVVDDIKGELSDFEDEYKQLLLNSDTLEDEYVSLMSEIVISEIPIAVQPSEINKRDFIIDSENIDSEELSDLFFGYETASGTEEAIFSWFVENIDMYLTHKVISIYYEDSSIPIISEFDFDLDSDLDYEGYLVIGEEYDNLIFNGEYETESGDLVTGITLDLDGQKVVSFAVEGEVGVFELPVYLAPDSSELSISASEKDEGGGLPNFWKFVIALVILLIIFFVGYILLLNWYKKNYEASLFKSKNDLYNLLYFIKNSKRQKLTDKQIENKLKKSKWKSEQIDYAFDKFYGRNTGMWEPGFMRKVEKKRLDREVEKRKGRRTSRL